MSDNEQVDTTKSKWHWKRKCACSECMFYSWEERPECPAMLADKTLVGTKLWYMDESMLGVKDYYDPVDHLDSQGRAKPKPEVKELDKQEEE